MVVLKRVTGSVFGGGESDAEGTFDGGLGRVIERRADLQRVRRGRCGAAMKTVLRSGARRAGSAGDTKSGAAAGVICAGRGMGRTWRLRRCRVEDEARESKSTPQHHTARLALLLDTDGIAGGVFTLTFLCGTTGITFV